MRIYFFYFFYLKTNFNYLFSSDGTAKDMFDHNVIELAEENGHDKLVKYFKKHAKGHDGCLIA